MKIIYESNEYDSEKLTVDIPDNEIWGEYKNTEYSEFLKLISAKRTYPDPNGEYGPTLEEYIYKIQPPYQIVDEIEDGDDNPNLLTVDEVKRMFDVSDYYAGPGQAYTKHFFGRDLDKNLFYVNVWDGLDI